MKTLTRRILLKALTRITHRAPAPAARPERLQLTVLEDRLVPDGRPLPLPFVFVGGATGSPPLVRAYYAETGELAFERQPFDAGFTGGVRVAAGDVNHDGIPDLIAAAGPGAGPHVKVYDGTSGELIDGPLGSFYAYGDGFAGGVYVASGDVDGDGWADVITAAGAGAGPHVKVFSGRTAETIASFYAFAPSFAGGATVAAADFTGDGKAELVVGAGPGAGPHVKVFDLSTGGPIAGPLGSFYAFDPSVTAGVEVGADFLAGDVTGDGRADLVVGLGAGVGSRVRVFDGASGAVVSDFSPFGAGMTAGVRVAVAYVNDDARADVVVGTGAGVPGAVKVFDGVTSDELPTPMGAYTPFGDGYTGGLYVGASNDPELDPLPGSGGYWVPGGSGGFEVSGGSGGPVQPEVVSIGPGAPGSETNPAVTGRGWFAVYRSGPGAALTVSYSVAPAPSGATPRATPGVDYTGPVASGGSIAFATNQTVAYLYVTPVDDAEAEGTEEVKVVLEGGTGYTIAESGGSAVLTIADNDTSGGASGGDSGGTSGGSSGGESGGYSGGGERWHIRWLQRWHVRRLQWRGAADRHHGEP
ncbi:MAG TPA: FG-GAP-like repeat-containing protein, partial [Gemmata sp.]